MIRIKTDRNGVKINGIQPETIVGILIAASVFDIHNQDFTITSVTDGAEDRVPGSLHSAGLAFDIRTWSLSGFQLEKIVYDLQQALGEEWDVINEEDHIHVEYDPK
jgi:hypothetical protein